MVGLFVTAAVAGCSYTDGKPVAATATAATTKLRPAQVPRVTPITTVAPAPTGPPVGIATMKVIGGDTPVTITYRINGGAEQTETGVNLPWEMQYPVYDEVQTSVTADAGDQALTCTITMAGKLASYKTEVHPTCSFAYYG